MRRHLVLSSIAVSLFLAAADPAAACINGMLEEEEIDPSVAAADRAADALDRGGNAEAFRVASRWARRADARGESGMHITHLMAIQAIAAVRLRGGVDWDRGRVWHRADDAARAANLRRAVEVLAPIEGETVVYGAWHAQAQAASGRTEEARRTLENLAGRDVMPDATAWRVLADLRSASGDAVRAEEARARCRVMAGRRWGARVCGAATPVA